MGGIVTKKWQNLSQKIKTSGDRNDHIKISSNQVQAQSPIFKLNIDCLDKIFDYLSFHDVNSIGQACKPLYEFAGEYFQANYVTEVYVEPKSVKYPRHWNCELPGFDEFVQNIRISNNIIANETLQLIEERARCISNNSVQAHVKQIHFIFADLTTENIKHLRNILQNIESVAIVECKVDAKFCELFPKLCPNLKRLYVRDLYYRSCRKPHIEMLMLCKYPKLEHFHWSRTMHGTVMNELKTFFKLNPHVRSFATDMISLSINQRIFIESQINLDDLTIENIKHFRPRQIIDHTHFNRVNELYEKSIFKRLHYDMDDFDQQMIDQMAPLHPLKSLRMDNSENENDIVNLPNGLVDLVELEIGRCGGSFNANALAHQLMKLERIYFGLTNLNAILPFLYHSVRLKKLKIDEVAENDGNLILDLATLNEKRKQLNGARKVTIFIDEKVYLATKWAMNAKEFNLIEIRRGSAHEWGHQFIPEN